MLKIKRLILENFQSHKYSVINFTEGLNAIVGPTDSGKTAIFRGIKWAIYNEPQGDYFIREGEKEVSVKIEFNNGLLLERYRTRSKNGYSLTYPEGEVMKFEGFGTKVPEEIIDAIKMPKIDLTTTENRSLNMAEQLDGPFLLADSPSVKAAAIGKLVEADVVDEALADVNIDLRNKKRKLKESKDLLDNINEELKEFEYLKELKLTITKLEEIEGRRRKTTEYLEKLEAIRNRYSQLRIYKDSLENSLKQLSFVDKIEENYYKIASINSRLTSLNRLQSNKFNNRRSKEVYSKILNDLSSTEEISEKIQNVDKKSILLKNLENKSKELKFVVNRKNKIILLSESLDNIEEANLKKEKVENLLINYTNLFKLNTGLKILIERIKNGEKYTSKFIYIDDANKVLNKLEEKDARLEKLIRNRNTYRDISEKIKFENNKIMNFNKDIKLITNRYSEFLRELKICPTCYRPIDHNNIEDLVKHLSE